MFIDKKNLLRLIEESVDRVLREQETPETPEPEPAGGGTPAPADTGADATTPEPAPTGTTGTTGTTPTGAGPAGGGTAPTPDAAAGGETPGIPGEEGVPGEEGAPADAGGGGFAGFTSGGGGGGSKFGDEGQSGTDADEPEEEELASTIGPEDVEIPADPVMAIVDDAITMLNQTKQPQVILAGVKSSIQKYFPEIEDATPVIKSLWDTEDVVLRDVARRLLLFIKGI